MRLSRTAFTAVAVCALTLGLFGPAMTPLAAAAGQQEAEEEAGEPVTFTVEARTCPEGYDGVEFAADCEEPLAEYAFDLLGPEDDTVETDEEGRAEFAEVAADVYEVEALDLEPDEDSFIVECGVPGPEAEEDEDAEEEDAGPVAVALPADITYSEYGFEIDLAAELERAADATEERAVRCTWYGLPGVGGEERPAILEIDRRVCAGGAGGDDDLAVLEPGGSVGDLDDAVARRAECDAIAGRFSLEGDAGDESIQKVDADQPVRVRLEPGTYVLTDEESGAEAELEVVAGEVTMVVAVGEAQVAQEPEQAGQEPEAAAPTVAAPPAASVSGSISFGSGDWQGAFPNISSGVYDRPAVAVYGRLSPYPTATLTFNLDAAPPAGATIDIVGVDDELAQVPISVEVNGTVIYEGPSGFADWGGVSGDVPWTTRSFGIPEGVLVAGQNTITVRNQAESAAFGLPPYILLSDATLTFAGS